MSVQHRVKFLEENLWGQRLLQDTEKMFNHPKMKDFIARLPQPTPEVEEESMIFTLIETLGLFQ